MLGYAIAIVRKLKINHKNFGGYSDENEQKSSRYFISSNEYDDFTGCGSSESEKKADNAAAGSKIVVISREDGSGTRGAFIELFGIEKKDADGKKIDHTTDNAAITNNTSVMMTTVAGNKDAIGYISLGSLNDTVKALKIDGAEASAANVKAVLIKSPVRSISVRKMV